MNDCKLILKIKFLVRPFLKFSLILEIRASNNYIEFQNIYIIKSLFTLMEVVSPKNSS